MGMAAILVKKAGPFIPRRLKMALIGQAVSEIFENGLRTDDDGLTIYQRTNGPVNAHLISGPL